MNRISLSVASIVMMVAVGAAYAASTPLIEQTAHNFTGQAWAGGEICRPCHTPHNAQDPLTVSTRLWSHRLADSANYSIRHGSTISSGHSADEVLDRVSRMCMGCHDGTIAKADYVNAPAGYEGEYVNAAQGTMIGNTAANPGGGVDLSNQHAVGETGLYAPIYPNHPKKNYYKAAVQKSNGDWEVPVYNSATLKLPLQKMDTKFTDATGAEVPVVGGYVVGCSTCHAPHGASGATVNGVVTPLPFLLRATNTGSTLCFSCHVK